jgi:hypothetical protein
LTELSPNTTELGDTTYYSVRSLTQMPVLTVAGLRILDELNVAVQEEHIAPAGDVIELQAFGRALP